MRKITTFTVTATIGLLLPACTSWPQPTEIWVSGGDVVNPADGSSTPVNFRIYQLTDKKEFADAEFDALWNDDKSVLTTTLVARSDQDIASKPLFVVAKTEEKSVTIELMKETRFIGLMGLFNDEDKDKKWKTVVPVDQIGDVRFKFQGFQIESVEN